VARVTFDKLDDFNPLSDAVVFDEESVNVELNQAFKINMKGKDFDLEKGEQKIPTYLAVFLIGRNIANII